MTLKAKVSFFTKIPLDNFLLEIISTFRGFHEKIIKSDLILPYGDFECEGLEQEERNNIGLVSYVIDTAWRGEEISSESIQKVFYYYCKYNV